ncbi:ABC transporter ATP-binding protein [Polynucleobacter paneuropaeus]|nr:ABC transporter ATP-binding protein [Polynucleobacter paneuropaeus]
MNLNFKKKWPAWSILSDQHKRHFFILLFFTIIGAIVEAFSIGLLIPILSLIANTGSSTVSFFTPILGEFASSSPNRSILIGVCLLVGIYLFKTAYLSALGWRQASYIYAVKSDIAHRLFKCYLEKPYSFYLEKNSGELVSNVINETTQLAVRVLVPSMLLVTELLMMLGIASVLFYAQPLGAIILCCVAFLVIKSFQWLTRSRLKIWGSQRQNYDAEKLKSTQEAFGGIKELKLMGRENVFLKRFDVSNYGGAAVEGRELAFQQFPRYFLEIVAVLILSVLILTMIYQGKSIDLIIPTVGLFSAAAFRMMTSANRIINSLQGLRYASPIVALFEKELSVTSYSEKSPKGTKIIFKRTIEVESLFFSYSNSDLLILNNLDLIIKSGDSIGIIGSSGAGKSTFIDLLLGLFPPTKGRILVDGVDVSSNIYAWRSQVGYVQQNIFLLDDTIKKNVTFGLEDEEIDDALVNRVLELAQLRDYIAQLPLGINTIVGERGARMSGGQRQRIGIARALYRKSSLIIFDEATSALDSETEAEVMQSIVALKGRITTIIVAHRLSTIKACNAIYRLEKGSLIKE